MDLKLGIQSSVICQLQKISDDIFNLYTYFKDVGGEDNEDTKFYLNLFNMIDGELSKKVR